jgi:release factor glutamine methyltransferase
MGGRRNLEHTMDTAELYRLCAARLAAGLSTLPDKPEETLTATLAALWHAAAGQPLSILRAERAPLPPLDAEGAAELDALLQRRIQGEPVAYLTGRQSFMGLELLAGAEALIPRVETELLGQAALERLRAIVGQQGTAIVVDVCTGSGNLALALASQEPRSRVWGADLSEEAVGLARRNADFAGLTDHVEFRSGDLLAPFDEPRFLGSVDLLVCNPPYISSGKVDSLPGEIGGHEPRLAFDGGPLGIRILTRLINEAPRFVRPGGSLAFEIGLGQGQGVCRRLEKHSSYDDVQVVADQSGDVRVLVARVAP